MQCILLTGSQNDFKYPLAAFYDGGDGYQTNRLHIAKVCYIFSKDTVVNLINSRLYDFRMDIFYIKVLQLYKIKMDVPHNPMFLTPDV